MSSGKQIVISGGFDDIKSRDLRFLQEAAKLGELNVLLWPDETLQRLTGKAPKFPMAERLYLLQAVRYVTRVVPMNASQDINALPETDKLQPGLWVDEKGPGNDARRAYCSRYNLEHHVLPASAMQGFPEPPPTPSAPGRKKVIATGCYD
jgi:hypothetical protein